MNQQPGVEERPTLAAHGGATEDHPAMPPALVVEMAALGKPVDFDTLFGRKAPVEIEIGIGSGYFLSRYARVHPEVNLLGMDKEGSEVYRTQDKCRRLGASNVRVLKCDAIYFLEEYVAPESIQTFHVYYSDPWPKKRHHKRRLWREAFARQVERALVPGGLLYLKTDVTSYFEVIQEVMKAADAMQLMENYRLDEAPIEGDYATNFQRKALEKGHPLHYQIWKKRGA